MAGKKKKQRAGKKRGPQEVRNARRSRRALDMRARGFTYPEIGKALGITKAGAFKIVQRALAKVELELAPRVKKLELLRLDVSTRRNDMVLAKLERLFVRMRGHDKDLVLSLTRAEQTRLRIMDRRALYLGLDAPRAHTLIPLEEAHEVRPRLENLPIEKVRELREIQRMALGPKPEPRPVVIDAEVIKETENS